MGIHYLYFRYITISARKPLRAESIHIVFAPIKYHPESLLPPYHTYHTYLYHYTPTAPTVPTSTTTNYYRTTLLLAIVYEQQTAAFLLAKARHTPQGLAQPYIKTLDSLYYVVAVCMELV